MAAERLHHIPEPFLSLPITLSCRPGPSFHCRSLDRELSPLSSTRGCSGLLPSQSSSFPILA